jgi:hypothetical protein
MLAYFIWIQTACSQCEGRCPPLSVGANILWCPRDPMLCGPQVNYPWARAQKMWLFKTPVSLSSHMECDSDSHLCVWAPILLHFGNTLFLYHLTDSSLYPVIQHLLHCPWTDNLVWDSCKETWDKDVCSSEFIWEVVLETLLGMWEK